jgi:hypothetical protein
MPPPPPHQPLPRLLRRYLLQPLLHSLPQLGLLAYLLAAQRSAMGAALLGCVAHSAVAHVINLLHKAYRCAARLARRRLCPRLAPPSATGVPSGGSCS